MTTDEEIMERSEREFRERHPNAGKVTVRIARPQPTHILGLVITGEAEVIPGDPPATENDNEETS